MNIDFEGIKLRFEELANAIYKDNDRVKELIDSAKKMVKENKELSAVVDDLRAMIGLLVDSLKGNYDQLQKNSAILIIISLLYLVSPIDLIPDFLVGGYIDDIAVIGFVFKRLSEELDRYKEWKGLSSDQRVYTSDDFVEINLDDDIIDEETVDGEYDIDIYED